MADDGLQFDKAEFQAPPGAPASASAAAGPTCAFCRRPLARYWAIGDQLACGDCHEQVVEQLTGGSPALRFARASVFGLIAATLGTVLWITVMVVTGLQLGLVAIVVGYMVGWAVAKGADHRGGPAYQGLAVVLTYAAIVAVFVPVIVLSEMTGEQLPSASEWLGTVPRAFVHPFRDLSKNFIGIIIISFGLYEAYRRNVPRPVPMSGPHDVAPGSRGTKLPVVPAA